MDVIVDRILKDPGARNRVLQAVTNENMAAALRRDAQDKLENSYSVYYIPKDAFNTKAEAPAPDYVRLQAYFGRPGFQVGAITVADQISLGLRSACYVANLRSLAVK